MGQEIHALLNKYATCHYIENLAPDGVYAKDAYITVIWDKTGTHYDIGAELKLFADGKLTANLMSFLSSQLSFNTICFNSASTTTI
jgi:hypothetical protein